MQKELNSTDEEKEVQKELNYTLDKKKQDIIKLKECAKTYKEKLLGKRFLVVFDNLNYIEVIFTKKQFKHLTGISSDLSAVAFYDFCIGKKWQNNRTVYISPKDIYTTIEHPRVFAIKKMEVFSLIRDLFEKSSYVLTEISENKRSADRRGTGKTVAVAYNPFSRIYDSTWNLCGNRSSNRRRMCQRFLGDIYLISRIDFYK